MNDTRLSVWRAARESSALGAAQLRMRNLTGGTAARTRAREAPVAPRGFSSFAVAYGHAMDSRCAAAPLRKNDKSRRP
jgi:hypothetical protein